MGRRSIFDNKKTQKTALEMAEQGATFKDIAHHFRRDSKSLNRYLKANTGFAALLTKARDQVGIQAKKCILTSVGRNWKAAAWYLERTEPESFAKRSADAMEPAEVVKFMAKYFEKVKFILNPDQREQLAAINQEMIVELMDECAVPDGNNGNF